MFCSGTGGVAFQLVAFNVFLAIVTAYRSYQDFSTHAAICTGDDKFAYFKLLMESGYGAARPALLEVILSRRIVVIDEDLSDLGFIGLRAIARAIQQSRVVESVTFKNTGIDDLARRLDGIGWCENFSRIINKNVSHLKVVNFEPKSKAFDNARAWDFSFVGSLQEVRHGSRVLYSFNGRYPATELRKAVEQDCFNATTEAIKRAPVEAAACPFYPEDHPMTSFSTPPEGYRCDLCNSFLLKDAIMKGCRLCNYDICSGCLVGLNSWQRRRDALLAAKWDCSQALLAFVDSDPTRPQRDADLLRDAAFFGSLMAVKLLIDYRANLNALGTRGLAPLHAAALNDQLGIATLLIEAKADVEVELPTYRNRPLHLAAMVRSVQVAKLLLEHKADVSSESTFGCPLHFCATSNCPSIAKMLIQAKAVVNMSNAQRDHPLSVACMWRSAQVAKILLNSRADLQAVNHKGETALGLARLIPHNEECVAVFGCEVPAAKRNFFTRLLGVTGMNCCYCFVDESDHASLRNLRREIFENQLRGNLMPFSVASMTSVSIDDFTDRTRVFRCIGLRADAPFLLENVQKYEWERVKVLDVDLEASTAKVRFHVAGRVEGDDWEKARFVPFHHLVLLERPRERRNAILQTRSGFAFEFLATPCPLQDV
jgi:ankyrin repeat protein